MIRILLVLITLCLALGAVVAQDKAADVAFEREILAKINQWRLDAGLWPLRADKTLRAMALDQALYLDNETNIPQQGGDFHRDRNGLYPRQRAQTASYNWPTYNTPAEILITENAGVGSVTSIVNFWRSSDLHSRAITSSDYREIGVAALAVGSDRLVIVTFGARPNVLPALVDPRDGRLLLSNDRSEFAARYPDILSNATTVQILATDGTALTGPVAWERSLPVPDGAPAALIVRYSDGTNAVDTTIDRRTDVAILPGFTEPPVVEAEPVAPDVVVESAPEVQTDIAPDGVVEAELLAAVNNWRADESLWPLRPNATLDALALAQATYLVQETDIPAKGGDFHTGADGKGPAERAASWPTYGESVVVAENAAVGSVDFALQFWRQSSTDRDKALSDAYREVGVAALPFADGYVLVMVFGARPNVLPTYYQAGDLLLTNETNTGGSGIGSVESVWVFDADGQPLIEGVDWSPRLTVKDPAYVLYDDGTTRILSVVQVP